MGGCVTVMTIDEETTADDLIEALGNLNESTKKLQQIIGSEEWTSPWDVAHERINALLDALEEFGHYY